MLILYPGASGSGRRCANSYHYCLSPYDVHLPHFMNQVVSKREMPRVADAVMCYLNDPVVN